MIHTSDTTDKPTTSDSIDKLMPAIHAARKAMCPAYKSAENKFHRYRYANEVDWHDAVMPALLDNGLTMDFSIRDIENLPDRVNQKGNTEYVVRVTGTACVTHISGQWKKTACVGDGQSGDDKSVYIAITGMKKYGYSLMFALPTTDDPEHDDTIVPPSRTSGSDIATPPKPSAPKTAEETMEKALAAMGTATTDDKVDRIVSYAINLNLLSDDQRTVLVRLADAKKADLAKQASMTQ
jgi:hypothetical protein